MTVPQFSAQTVRNSVGYRKLPSLLRSTSGLQCETAMETTNNESLRSARYRLGKQVIGPALAAFTYLLLVSARRDGITRLAFVARDGEFLLRVTEEISRHLPWSPPELDYIYLSRISTALPSQPDFGFPSLQEAWKIQAGKPSVRSLLGYFGLDAGAMTAELSCHGLTAETTDPTPEMLSSFTNDPRVTHWIDTERRRQAQLLQCYLEQHMVLDNASCALVDIGWRGSIPSALAKAFPCICDRVPLRGYNLGYWHDTGTFPSGACNIVGLLSDYRRTRNVVEAAPHYVAFVLEAICRAGHGTVVGYRREEGGAVVPILADGATQREAELAGEDWRKPIREGVLEYVKAHRFSFPGEMSKEKDVRLEAQKSLLRLAFFPTADEIDAISRLVHTEGHYPDWSRPLIDPIRPSPFRSPRRWLLGLSSPWRSGYVAATGGALFSIAFILVESILIAAPVKIRRAAERIAWRWSKPS
jgi:hypothetical protein